MVDHLLVHCSKARLLRNLPLPFLDLIGCVHWRDSPLLVGKRSKKAWMAAPLLFYGLFRVKGTTLLLTTNCFRLKG